MDLKSLTLKSDFARIRSSGVKFSTPAFSAVYVVSQNPEIRVAFALSRKVANAVKRNRIRRRIREAMRLELKETTHVGCDILFIPRKYAYDCEWLNIQLGIKKMFSVIDSK